MSDKFEDFLDRLEMPLPEPKVVRIADRIIDVHETYLGLSRAYIQYALKLASASSAPMSKVD
jgi:hypothetical protein